MSSCIIKLVHCRVERICEILPPLLLLILLGVLIFTGATFFIVIFSPTAANI